MDGTERPAGGGASPSTRNRRQVYEARQYRRSVIIATASTIAAIVAVVVLVPMAPGWERVKASFFNWEIFIKTFPTLAEAFLLDIAIFLWCAPIIAAWSLVLALMRDVRLLARRTAAEPRPVDNTPALAPERAVTYGR